jgi:CheY-like chemotaxis protein
MGIRVLVVEDEPIIGLDIRQQLASAGFEVLGPATSVASALQLIAEPGCDVAIQNVNLGNETSEPIARKLRASFPEVCRAVRGRPSTKLCLVSGQAHEGNSIDGRCGSLKESVPFITPECKAKGSENCVGPKRLARSFCVPTVGA